MRGISIAIVLLAVVLRFWMLDLRPLHADEGVNGWLADRIRETGYFHYDPTSFHGPLHFYAVAFSEAVLGRTVWALRLPVALVSTASVLLMLSFRRYLGNRICGWAALAIAVSPGAVYYGRDAIHESWLALFLLLIAWGLAGLYRFGKDTYLIATGLGFAGMILTKETYAIHVIALVLTLAIIPILSRISLPAFEVRASPTWSWKDLALVVGGSIALVLFFYSGNFRDPASIKGIYQTFAAQFGTGIEGEGHEKPWWYWLGLLARYEWAALIGLIVSPFILWPGSHWLLRYLAIYGCGTFVAYSIIPYKTPWCVVSIIWPFFLLFGAAVNWVSGRWGRGIATTLALFLTAASLAASIRLNLVHATDEAESYVYVQTSEDIRKITEPLSWLTREDPTAVEMTGYIILDYSFPLPWLLGDFSNVGYYEEGMPEEPDADFLVVDESRLKGVEAALRHSYFAEPMVMRSDELPATLFFREDMFRSVFPGRNPEFVPQEKVTPSGTRDSVRPERGSSKFNRLPDVPPAVD